MLTTLRTVLYSGAGEHAFFQSVASHSSGKSVDPSKYIIDFLWSVLKLSSLDEAGDLSTWRNYPASTKTSLHSARQKLKENKKLKGRAKLQFLAGDFSVTAVLNLLHLAGRYNQMWMQSL